MLVWTALGAMFVMIVALAIISYQQRKQLVANRELFSSQLKALRNELSAVSSAAIGVGQHLIATERKLASSVERQQQFEVSGSDRFPYNQALSLVDKGADATQLVERCGLSEAEASLMTLVKGAAAGSADSAS